MSQQYRQLFSIDVDAHLKKAASHTFGSPAHYPVELVRAALRRGAGQVDVTFSKNRIQVEDNGKGMDSKAIETLICLMNPSVPVAEKEAAVEAMQTREGMGLLAIFAPDPSEVTIENAPAPPGKKLRLQFLGKKQFHLGQHTSLQKGTAVTMVTRNRDMEQEKQLLDIFCRAVKKDIRLNGQVISGRELLTRQMATLEVSPSKHTDGGQVGIPRTGNLCRLQLLDRGIPWHHLTLPPRKGFVFDAAVEYRGDPGDITRGFIQDLTQYAQKLYQWMCKRYSTAEPHHQDRIEELIFTHCRLTGDVSLIHQFSPFKLYDSIYFLDLARLREIASENEIYAVPRSKEHLRYNPGAGNHKTVLSLTREQADLLINFLKLPVTFLSPVRKRLFRWWNWRIKIKNAKQRLLLSLFPSPQKIVAGAHLTPTEKTFLSHLNKFLSEHPDRFPGQQAVMIPSKFPFPVIKSPAGNLYMLRRHHPLVQKAIHAVQSHPGNIELLTPFL
jgi:hypothetical protein